MTLTSLLYHKQHSALMHTLHTFSQLYRDLFQSAFKSISLHDLITSSDIHQRKFCSVLMHRLRVSIPQVNPSTLNGTCIHKWTMVFNLVMWNSMFNQIHRRLKLCLLSASTFHQVYLVFLATWFLVMVKLFAIVLFFQKWYNYVDQVRESKKKITQIDFWLVWAITF